MGKSCTVDGRFGLWRLHGPSGSREWQQIVTQTPSLPVCACRGKSGERLSEAGVRKWYIAKGGGTEARRLLSLAGHDEQLSFALVVMIKLGGFARSDFRYSFRLLYGWITPRRGKVQTLLDEPHCGEAPVASHPGFFFQIAPFQITRSINSRDTADANRPKQLEPKKHPARSWCT